MAITAWQQGWAAPSWQRWTGRKIAALLDIPEEREVVTVLALGYPSHQSTLVPGEEGKLAYYVDEARDYYVPKLPLEKVAEFK